MPANPACLVQVGAGPFVPTTGGVDVTPGQVISIKLADPSAVTLWQLEVTGTDELTATPILSNVSYPSDDVVSPTSIVTFTWPGSVGDGRAIGFKSEVNGGGVGLVTKFGLFSLCATNNLRVGFLGQTREGSDPNGWTTTLNPVIRASGTGGGGSGNATSIQGTPVQAGGASIVGQTVIFDGSQYAVRQLTEDDILPSFAISSFNSSPSGFVELGSTVNNPSFTASYTTPPDVTANSVTLVDDQGGPTDDETGSPTAFTYFQGYTFVTYGQGVIFTLSATKGALTRTSNRAITWVQQAYHGVGPAGQNTAVFIQSLTGFLTNTRNTTFSESPGAGQKIYYAYRTPYGAATFTVGGFGGGFNLVSTTISVTNTYGVIEDYTLYESAQANLGPTVVTVT